VRPRIQLGRGVSARDYLLALAEREEHRRAYAAATDDIDAVLTPTTLTPAVPVDEVDQTTTPAHFTRAANYLGLCAVAVPNGFTKGGLPTSLQIACAGGREAMALRVAWAYEKAQSGRSRRPPEPGQPA
jgi:aspartyl-tRNA(Asn)/glutamyl-tRNA(Gln) amidotransferase subunit A